VSGLFYRCNHSQAKGYPEEKRHHLVGGIREGKRGRDEDGSEFIEFNGGFYYAWEQKTKENMARLAWLRVQN